MSICSSWVLANAPAASPGVYTDQNTAPTPPARRRGMSVCPSPGALRADVVGVDVARRVLELADGPGQVVVAVEQDALGEHGFRVLEGGIGVGVDGCRGERRPGRRGRMP